MDLFELDDLFKAVTLHRYESDVAARFHQPVVIEHLAQRLGVQARVIGELDAL